MLPSTSTQFEYCEKIANEVFKYGVLMKKKVKTNYDNQKKLKEAYQELAKTFYLTDAMSGYKLLEHLVKFCLELICMKVRENLYQGEYGVLSTCPRWVQILDKPLGLMQIVYKQFRKSTKSKLATCLFSHELLAAIKRTIDNSVCEVRHVVLHKRDSVRSHALSLGLPVARIHNLWKKMYKVSILKLEYLLEASDINNNVHKALQLTKIEKKILDLGLLYDSKVRVVKKASFFIDEKLNVMIFLYKLMLEANVTYSTYVRKNGARTGADKIYKHSENVENNDEHIIIYDNLQNKKSCETLEIWALVYLEYMRRGFDASFVLLQKRWYEMKSLTRRLLHPSVTRKNRVPHLLLIAMSKRLPYILSDELPSWVELGNNGQIYTESDISALPDELTNMRLNVKENISVNDILEELCEDNQDDIQLIETELDTIDIDDDSDSDVNNYSEIDYSNQLLNKDTIMPKITSIQGNVTEPEIKKKLAQKLSNTGVKIKSTIIIEDDFDIDKELKMFKMKQNNSASTNNAFGNDLSVVKEPIQNMDTEMNDALDANVSESEDDMLMFDLKRNSNGNVVKQSLLNDSDDDDINTDDEQHNEGNEESIIDKKLFLLPKVVLKPVEKTSLWQKYQSDANEIDLKLSESTLNMATSQVITQSEIMTQSNNEKSNPHTKTVEKNKAIATEDKDIRKKLQNKRKFLMRHLKLSKTSHSKEFWSERNINLLEQCKLVSVTLNRVTRVAKKVELSDIDEIRRINKTILTAQVAPMTHTHPNSTVHNSTEKIQQNKVDEENANERGNDNSSNSETNPVTANGEMMLKKIVVKKFTSNPINNTSYKKPSTAEEIEWLNFNIDKHICNMLDVLVNRDCKMPMRNRKPRNRKRNGKKLIGVENTQEEDLAFNSIDEWQRQKNFTRKYFHLKPVPDVIENKSEHNNEQKQNSTETKQYDSDDTNLIIDEDVKIKNKGFNKVNKPLKDKADISIKKEINEINNGISEISKKISIDSEMVRSHKVKVEINDEVSEISNKISIDCEMFDPNKVKIEINDRVSEISNRISMANKMFGTHKVKTEINNEIPINKGIFVNNEIIETSNDITERNNDILINNGINEINIGTSCNNINNQINETDLDTSRNNDSDLIVISSDDDDDVKPIINDTAKLNENAIKSSNNGTSVPQLVKILPKSLQNPTIDVNNHNVINMLSKVAYNIKSKTQNVRSNVPSKSHPPPLQLIKNKIKNDTPLSRQSVNSPKSTLYLIKVPSETAPSNSFPMPVIQSVESLSVGEKVVITKTNQTSPIVYNDLLKNDQSPESSPSLLTNTNIINNVSLKRLFPVKGDRLKIKPPLTYKRKEKKQRNTNKSLLNTDKKDTIYK